MARLSDFSTGPELSRESDPTTPKGMALRLMGIAQDLDARRETEPRDALLAAADGLIPFSLDFALIAKWLAALDDDLVSAGANEMAVAVTHLMIQFGLAIRNAGAGGSSEIDLSVDAHRPRWALHL